MLNRLSRPTQTVNFSDAIMQPESVTHASSTHGGTYTVGHQVRRNSAFQRPLAEKRVQRRFAAILAANVDGYSRLMREDEARTQRMAAP